MRLIWPVTPVALQMSPLGYYFLTFQSLAATDFGGGNGNVRYVRVEREGTERFSSPEEARESLKQKRKCCPALEDTGIIFPSVRKHTISCIYLNGTREYVVPTEA